MKALIYAGIVAAVIAAGWWLRYDAVKDYKEKLELQAAEHKAKEAELKRLHDGTKRELEAKTKRLLAELNAIKSDVCYRLDDPLPSSYRRLLDPGSR